MSVQWSGAVKPFNFVVLNLFYTHVTVLLQQNINVQCNLIAGYFKNKPATYNAFLQDVEWAQDNLENDSRSTDYDDEDDEELVDSQPATLGMYFCYKKLKSPPNDL